MDNSSREFLRRYYNREYISKYLDKLVNPSIKPTHFNLEQYNEYVLRDAYDKYKLYFSTMYNSIDNNIKLDEEQIRAILSDEQYSLIIAGAGTGKTTTMAAKVKYLVDIKKVDPSKILVMSYTKKATEELDKRIRLDFNIPAMVTTFHSLGYLYIRTIFQNHKCSVIDDNDKNKIFLQYLKERLFPRKNSVKILIDVFSNDNVVLFGNFFKNNYDKFDTYDEFYQAYKDYRIGEITDLENYIQCQLENDYNQENIYTIKNELVKSKGEAQIANFLFMNQIPYSYEKIYSELLDNYQSYHPDFTLNLGNQEIYIEYFGLSTVEKEDFAHYKKIAQKKIEYHKKHHNKFIALDYAKGQDLLTNLKSSLESLGFSLNKLSNEKIVDKLLDRFALAQVYSLRKLYFDCIDKIKTSIYRTSADKIIEKYLNELSNEEKENATLQYKFIKDFYLYYQKYLFSDPSEYKFDFPDMIYYANKYIHNMKNNKLNFEYIIIDEYQDISQDKYTLVNNIIKKNHAKIVAVGDDWQSIYGFNGSKIAYIYNFQKYFPDAKLFYISKTYRNSQALIDYSGKFIMKNPSQIKKQLVSNKIIDKPICFQLFEDEISTLKELILSIHKKCPEDRILILARKNKNIKEIFNDANLIDSVGTQVTFLGYEDIKIDAMSIHKSKGLTYDEVIVIGLDKDFPNNLYNAFWLMDLFQAKNNEEDFSYAEERRVFYVALTRTKKHVYLLVDKDSKNRSPFVSELFAIIRNDTK